MPRNAHYPIPLDPKMDKKENVYYVGKANSPAKLMLDKGAAIFVFLAEEGAEEIQFDVPRPNSTFGPIKKRLTDEGPQWVIPLETKEDSHGKKYYFALVQDDNLQFDLSEDDGYVFFVFVSEPGKETLQVSKNKESYKEKVRQFANRQNPSRNVEVFRKKSDSGNYPAVQDPIHRVHEPGSRYGT